MIKNNKKGFTLIELLAVIVILSIIAVITVPLIMNVIDKAKLGALEDSAYGLVESANLWYAENVSNAVKDTKFTIEKNKQTSDNTDITKLLSYKGTIDKGYVSILSTGKVAVCIDNNTKKVEKGYSDSKVTTSNGKCDGTFVNEVGSADDSDVSTSTIKELQNRISAVESDVTDLKTQVNDINNNFTNIFNWYIENGYLPDYNLKPLIPVLTSNSQDGYILTYGSLYNSSNPGFLAFDGNDLTYAWLRQESGQFIQIQLPESKTVKMISILEGNGHNITVMGSNDGTTFTTITTTNGSANKKVNTSITPSTYKYWRFQHADNFSVTALYYTIQLYGI